MVQVFRRGIHFDPHVNRCRAKREQPMTFSGLEPESQGHNLALAVLHVPYSLDSGQEGARRRHALFSHTLQIPTVGALSPRGGPVQGLVPTPTVPWHARFSHTLRSCLALLPQPTALTLWFPFHTLTAPAVQLPLSNKYGTCKTFKARF